MNLTKTCPYCAEEIKAAAIVCKHCGRELPDFDQLKPNHRREPHSNQISSTTNKPTIWKPARTVGAIATLLYIINTIVQGNEIGFGPDFMGDIIFGSLFVYGLVTLLSAGIVWFWRSEWRDSAILYLGIILITLSIFLVIFKPELPFNFPSQNSDSILPTNQPIATIAPPTQPFVTKEELYENCIFGRQMSTQYFDSHLYKMFCIYGRIYSKDDNNDGSYIYNIFPDDQNIPFLIITPIPQILREVLPGALGVTTNAGVGECIIMIGYPSEDRIFTAIEVIDKTQLSINLGFSHPKVKTIQNGCR